MNPTIRRFGLPASIVFTLGLTACGGYTEVNLGGSVTGLTTSGLVLANGGDTVEIPANATAYVFPRQIGVQASYAVTVLKQPARLGCGVVNGSGNVTGTAVNWVNVICTPNTYNVTGTLTGLTVNGLVLTNGTDTVSPVAGAATFTFPSKVADGTVYGVAVLNQPPGLTCKVVNGTAVMGAGDVTNMQVNCI